MGLDVDDEIARRLVHVSGSAFPLAYVLDVLSWRQLGWVLAGGTIVALGLEGLRLSVGLDWRIFDRLTREYERDNLAGYFLYAVSLTLTALVFRPRVALPGMFMLTIADPVSGLLGSGELRATKRTLVLAVTFGTSVLIAIGFVPLLPAVCGALAATFADGVKPVIRGYVIDDNLTIPIAAAGAIEIGFGLLGVF
jgi:dolichol kinase